MMVVLGWTRLNAELQAGSGSPGVLGGTSRRFLCNDDADLVDLQAGVASSICNI